MMRAMLLIQLVIARGFVEDQNYNDTPKENINVNNKEEYVDQNIYIFYKWKYGTR